ncbi:MAG: hypothetical protein AB7F25_12345 [Deferribacterales bacterium]
METYHIRHFLNKEGNLATSQITAFYGEVPYETSEGETKYYVEKSLRISDCSKTIRIHETYGKPSQDFVDKLRLIAKTCNDFADHLDSIKQGR